MSRFLFSFILLSGLVFNQHTANALKYTTVMSGNFSSSTTWLGGIIPPLNINTSDTILIEAGHIVIQDQNITMSQSSALIDVQGTLRSTGSYYINLNGNVGLNVSGTLDIDSMVAANVSATITGQCSINKFRCLIFSASGGGNLVVDERLHVFGSLSNSAGNTISIAPNTEIYMLGGEIIASGTGILTFPGPYDVVYTNSAHVKPTGPELSGSGLRHVTVNLLTDTSELKLGSTLGMANGSLNLVKGLLALNNNNLNITGSGDISASGTGKIKSTSASDIEVNIPGSLSGQLQFSGNGNTVHNLVVNCGGSLKIGTALKVTGKVDFQNGKLDVQGNKLSLITGAGISGADASKYIITGAGGSLAADIGSGASFTYHVGTSTQYAPCVISSNNNTVYNGLSVGVNPGVKVFGTSGNNMAASQPLVDATWFVEHVNTTVNIDMELMWSAAMEVNNFDHNNAFISHLIGNYWDKDAAQSATLNGNGLFSIKRSGIMTLSPFAVFDRNTVGVDHIDSKTAFQVYPNPAGNVLHIRSEQGAMVNIINISGQSAIQQRLNKADNTVDISQLQPGTYVIRISGDDINEHRRFTKQ
ncbi:MAG TPA: T9SS type A sorting domain-containing protein [Flavipsychrobacter sp.]